MTLMRGKSYYWKNKFKWRKLSANYSSPVFLDSLLMLHLWWKTLAGHPLTSCSSGTYRSVKNSPSYTMCWWICFCPAQKVILNSMNFFWWWRRPKKFRFIFRQKVERFVLFAIILPEIWNHIVLCRPDSSQKHKYYRVLTLTMLWSCCSMERNPN